MMSDKSDTYTCTVVRLDGITHATSASGYFAESMIDRLFTEAAAHEQTLFCAAHAPGYIRQQWIRPRGNKEGSQ